MSTRRQSQHTRAATPSRKPRARDAARTLNRAHDTHEQEAERVAEAVTRGGTRAHFSFAQTPIAHVQRDEAKPPTQEDQYGTAAKKAGEAFLETDVGKEITAKAKSFGADFVSTLPGKIIAGSAAIGAVSALAATHQPLPVQIPELPLDIVAPGLKVKITYEGPVDKPTKAVLTFSGTFGEKPKAKQSEADKRRAETARLAADMAKFRAGMRYAPGTSEARQQKLEEDAVKAAALRIGAGPDLAATTKKYPALAPPTTTGLQLQTPPLRLGYQRPSLLGEAKLRPPEFKLTGEDEGARATPQADEPKKKEEPLQRKAAGDYAPAAVPSVVDEVLASPGQPLDAATQRLMAQRFGYDFRAVRIHADTRAAESARAVNAHAYTVGSDIVFDSGQFAPHALDGQALLAHELAHVVQQSEGAQPQLQRAATPPNAKEALQVALKGDDDDVRDLTKHAGWPQLQLTPAQAALLIMHLLDGATLDDDEVAGLRILNRMLGQQQLDDTLQELDNKARFHQLLDDYHGDEYDTLLDLLSNHMTRLGLKAHYLDEFVDMWSWFISTAERRAIVVLLEKCSDPELVALLTKNNRLDELRSKVSGKFLFIRLGKQTLSIRYETIAAKVNEANQKDLSSALRKVFEVKAKSALGAKQRTQEEIDQLLAKAANDLAREVLEYRARIDDALKAKDTDLGAIEEINKDFEKRLKELVEQKSTEFDLELKYNLEFNRMLFDPKRRGRSWTTDDLKDIDKILASLPLEILRANPKFRGFERAKEDPKVAGWAGHSGEIALFGTLTRGTVAHELGHIISYDNSMKLLNEWQKAFNWEALTAADLTKLIPDPKDRRKLQEKLDKDKEKDDDNAHHREGDFFYRWNRYAGSSDAPYYRYPKDACFISSYAETDPNDDFAESFEEYLLNPENLQKKCNDKYKFMHEKVFVDYLLGKQIEPVQAAFAKEAEEAVDNIYGNYGLRRDVSDQYINKIRDGIKAGFTTLQQDTLKQAETGKLKPLPLKGSEARKVAEPFINQLRDLVALVNPISTHLKQYVHKLEIDRLLVEQKLGDAHQTLSSGLVRELLREMLVLLDPLAQKILKGERVQRKTWPELDALVKKYEGALKVMDSYLPRMARTLTAEFDYTQYPDIFGEEKNEVGPYAFALLQKFRAKDPRRQKFKDLVVKRREELGKAAEQVQLALAQQAATGKPFKKAQSADPDTLIKAYKRDVDQFFRQQGKITRAVADASHDAPAASAPALAEAAAQSAGEPLAPEVRTEMEARLGFDFGRVRVHADTRAAQAAQALNAQAYTLGEHVVFGAGRYAPHTGAGRRLLAHELTHVAQQSGTPERVQAQAEEPSEEAARPSEPNVESELIQLPVLEEREPTADEDTPPASGTPSVRADQPSAEQPSAPSAEEPVIAAQRLDTASGASGALVPRDHPSEREADAVSRAIARDDQRPRIGRYPQSELAQRVARANGAKAAAPQPLDLVFLMGTDKNRKNPFYKNARLYFKDHVHYDALIDDKDHRSLDAVFDYLRQLDPKKQVVGNLYLVSHANEDGTLSFPLTSSAADVKEGHLTFGCLKSALKDSPALFRLPEGLITRDTVIHIKGCNIGRSTEMLNKLDEAFGGTGKVTAPTHKQVYGTETKDKKRATYEALMVYYLEHAGLVKLTVKEQLEQFQAKYTHLSEKTWQKIFPKRGTERQVVSVSYTYTNAASEDDALASARKWGKDNLPRPEMYEWRVAKRKGKNYWLVAEKTNYVIDKILVDDNLKRLTPDESNPDFFGQSTFRVARAPTDAVALATPDLLQRIADLSAELKTLSKEHDEERREMDAELAQMRAELQKRNVAIDVHVIKTEDWLGADEVYIKLTSGRQPIKTPQHDLNDGQSRTYRVPLAQLLPLNKAYRVQVYDADWPDADDLIVDMQWAPPYKPTQNTQSFDEANYKVTVRFEK